MIPISITHDRLISLRVVMSVAEHYVQATGQKWEDTVTEARSVVDAISRVHVRDANENGNCATCNPEAFALAERAKEHAAELAEFDQQLQTVV